MFCIECGNENPDRAKFCWECGTSLIVENDEEEPVSPDHIKALIKEVESSPASEVFYVIAIFVFLLAILTGWLMTREMDDIDITGTQKWIVFLDIAIPGLAWAGILGGIAHYFSRR